MNTLHFARTAYGGQHMPARSPRNIEYELLGRVTQRLLDAWDHRSTGFPALVAAVHRNTELWTTLAVDVAAPGNGLPAPLRAQLFYLFQFSEAHGRKVLAREATVAPLVEVNTAVMRGLRGHAGDPG